MRLKTSRQVWLYAVVLLLFLPHSSAFAENGNASAGRDARDASFDVGDCIRKIVRHRFLELIDASDEQRAKVSELLASHEQKTRAIRQEVRKEATTLLDQFADSQTTDQQMIDRCMQLRARKQEWMDENIKTMLKVRAVMNPEQRRALVNFVMGLLTGNWRRLVLPETKAPSGH